jgi:hypothetical protein
MNKLTFTWEKNCLWLSKIISICNCSLGNSVEHENSETSKNCLRLKHFNAYNIHKLLVSYFEISLQNTNCNISSTDALHHVDLS